MPPESDPDLVIFLTGSELGSLRPCGCSGGQLGGLEKRPAVLDSVPVSCRLTIDTGTLAADDGGQDLIKFRFIFEALGLLGYDAVCLTDEDQAIAQQLGLLANRQQAFAVLKDGDGGPSLFTKQFPDQDVSATVVVFDPRRDSVERTAQLLEGASGPGSIDILVLRDHDRTLLDDIISNVRGIDCIVCPSNVDEPLLLSKPGAKPLVVTVGRFGRHICRLGVTLPTHEGESSLRFEEIPVVADLPDDPALVQLYKQYQQVVREAGLLESYPRIPLPDGLAFTGSEDCRRCHEYEYGKWITKAHADALASLKRVGSDRDPECVICHVIGMEYEGGYLTEEKTPHLKDVGCENCHGPGSEHAQSNGVKPTRQPQMSCLQCHTPEKSTGFAGHEDQYLQKIVHWREPAAAGNVKP